MRYADDIGGFYELNPFPGCNQIVVSNHSWIPPEQRGKGNGTDIHDARLTKIRELGYDYALCTVRSVNLPQLLILKKAGWKHLDTFDNKETGHTICLYGKIM